MAGGVAVTGGVAYAIGRSERALHALFEGNARAVIVACFVVELLLVAGWSRSSSTWMSSRPPRPSSRTRLSTE
jgi:hypothetical protein